MNDNNVFSQCFSSQSRVLALQQQEMETLNFQMDDVATVDLVEQDEQFVAQDRLLEEQNKEYDDVPSSGVFSMVTGDSADQSSSSPEVADNDVNMDSEDIIVRNWEANGCVNIAKQGNDECKEGFFADGAFIPIKHKVMEGNVVKNLYVEGRKLLTGATSLQFHDANVLSMPYLDTVADGILHVIPGWSQREVLEDIAYRFKAGRTMETEIPFLGGMKCKKRAYECQGVLVCRKSTSEFRCAHHYKVEDENPHVLRNVELLGYTEVMKRTALNIVREISSKPRWFHPQIWDVSGVPKVCGGYPIVRERKGEVFYGNPYFLGCAGYRNAPNQTHAIRKLDTLDGEGLEFLKGLLSGREKPPRSDQDEQCFYVHGKKKRCNTICQIHREPLLHIPCEDHTMHMFEPLPQLGVEVPKMVYVSCFGKHSHPPSPPHDHTL